MSTPPSPMLATLGKPPTSPEGWAFEMKWDGQRAIAEVRSGETRLFSRNNNSIGGSYPDLASAIADAVGDMSAVLDGEIVALDAKGRPSFGRLQRRMHVLKPTAQLIKETPVAFYVFDVLELGGEDLIRRPYLERREILDEIGLASKMVQAPPFWTNVDADTMLDTAREHGLEGIVAKKVTSTYQPGRRSPAWIKTPFRNNTEAIVCGWIPGTGGAAGGIGSLLLGAHTASGELVYIGHVGTGFTAKDRRQLLAQLEAIEQPESPFDTPPPRSVARDAHWTRAELVGDVEYREFTERLRHPSWRGLRSDKTPDQVDWPGSH